MSFDRAVDAIFRATRLLAFIAIEISIVLTILVCGVAAMREPSAMHKLGLAGMVAVLAIVGQLSASLYKLRQKEGRSE